MNHRLFASVFIVLSAIATIARASDSVVLRTQQGNVAASTRTIQAENQFGNVTLTAVAEGFGWEWNLRTSDERTARAEASAQQDWQIEIRETDGALQLVVVRPETSRTQGNRIDGPVRHFLSWVTLGVVSANQGTVRSDLTLRVPAASVVDIKNRFGSVRVTGPRGAVNVECQHGKVDLSHIEGAVTARTSFGSLRVEKIGPAQLTTQNGNLEARGVGGDLRATTSFGKLTVRDVKGSAMLKNQNGAVDVAGITGDVRATTSFGDLRIAEVGGRAELKNQNGRVDMSDVTGTVTATNSFGPMRARSLGSGAELNNRNGVIEAVRVTGDVVATTSFAEMRIDEIGGEAILNSRSGKIEVTRVTGKIRAATSFAPLRAREIGGTAELDGQNSEIVATAIGGNIRAQTSFGRMQLEGSGQRFVARNQNGAVEIVARSPRLEEIVASASFAPIEVRLPNEAKPLIRATTSFGKVQSDFPVLFAATLSEAKFAADVTPLKINLRGQNGDIRIQQLAAR